MCASSHPRPRAALTLIEVAITIGVFATTVVAIVMLLPIGIRAQQTARYQAFAAAKVLELADSTSNQPFYFASVASEGRTPLDVPLNLVNNMPDLEQQAVNYHSQLYPLPTEIARRLDSDNDEIQKILDDGGRIFYFAPDPTSGLDPTATAAGMEGNQRQLAQNLVFAIVGRAQQNALNVLPMTASPYYVSYPAPPMPDLARVLAWNSAENAIRGMSLPKAQGPMARPMPMWEGQSFCYATDPKSPESASNFWCRGAFMDAQIGIGMRIEFLSGKNNKGLARTIAAVVDGPPDPDTGTPVTTRSITLTTSLPDPVRRGDLFRVISDETASAISGAGTPVYSGTSCYLRFTGSGLAGRSDIRPGVTHAVLDSGAYKGAVLRIRSFDAQTGTIETFRDYLNPPALTALPNAGDTILVRQPHFTSFEEVVRSIAGWTGGGKYQGPGYGTMSNYHLPMLWNWAFSHPFPGIVRDGKTVVADYAKALVALDFPFDVTSSAGMTSITSSGVSNLNFAGDTVVFYGGANAGREGNVLTHAGTTLTLRPDHNLAVVPAAGDQMRFNLHYQIINAPTGNPANSGTAFFVAGLQNVPGPVVNSNHLTFTSGPNRGESRQIVGYDMNYNAGSGSRVQLASAPTNPIAALHRCAVTFKVDAWDDPVQCKFTSAGLKELKHVIDLEAIDTYVMFWNTPIDPNVLSDWTTPSRWRIREFLVVGFDPTSGAVTLQDDASTYFAIASDPTKYPDFATDVRQQYFSIRQAPLDPARGDRWGRVLDPDPSWFHAENPDPHLPAKVQAMGYLANMLIRTAGQFPNAQSPIFKLAQQAQEATLRWAFRFQTHRPYDLRIPRPYNRPLMSDAPLFQFDLFGGHLIDPSWSAGANGSWRTWPIVQPKANVDKELSWMHPRSLDSLVYANAYNSAGAGIDWRSTSPWDGVALSSPPAGNPAWGAPERFNLTAPFAAAERCRQAVFWIADWQSYEDFESAPSAPMDSSRLYSIPYRTTPTPGYSTGDYHYVATSDWSFVGRDAGARVHNPEFFLVWRDSLRGARGATTPEPAPEIELGYFGADRNGNSRYDRGPTPKSTRLRAVQVGRYNMYDRRLHGSLRF